MRHQRACGGAITNCTFCTFYTEKYSLVQLDMVDKQSKLY